MSTKPVNTILIVVAVIAAAVAGSLATKFFSAYEKKSDIAVIDEKLRANDQTKRMIEAFSKYFPAEYEKSLHEMLAVRSNGTEADVQAAAYHFMKDFMHKQMPSIVAAPNESIQKIIDAQTGAITYLKQRDVKMCADFGMRGLGPNADIDNEALAKISDAGAVQVIAAHDGTQNPVTRTPPGAAEWKSLIAAMKANGASEALMSKIFIVGDINGLTVEEECDFSYILLTSMADLDAETRIRLFALFLQESVKL